MSSRDSRAIGGTIGHGESSGSAPLRSVRYDDYRSVACSRTSAACHAGPTCRARRSGQRGSPRTAAATWITRCRQRERQSPSKDVEWQVRESIVISTLDLALVGNAGAMIAIP
jgi:hypothetical protein